MRIRFSPVVELKKLNGTFLTKLFDISIFLQRWGKGLCEAYSYVKLVALAVFLLQIV